MTLLPAAPLRRSALSTAAVALAGVLTLALIAWAVLGLSPAYVVKTGVVCAVIVIVALLRLPGHHPFAEFGVANQITTARAVLVALLAGSLGEPAREGVITVATVVALLAVALDGLDGWIARRTGTSSRFGARFDMEVDALLIMILSALAWQNGKAGPWVLASGLMRYGFVAAGVRVPWLTRPLPPSARRKVMCVAQEAALVVLMIPAVTQPISGAVAAIALTLLSYSFLVDIAWLWRQAPAEGFRNDRPFVPADVNGRELEAPSRTS
jgi:phosphatidylglycerophosphate synthase